MEHAPDGSLRRHHLAAGAAGLAGHRREVASAEPARMPPRPQRSSARPGPPGGDRLLAPILAVDSASAAWGREPPRTNGSSSLPHPIEVRFGALVRPMGPSRTGRRQRGCSSSSRAALPQPWTDAATTRPRRQPPKSWQGGFTEVETGVDRDAGTANFHSGAVRSRGGVRKAAGVPSSLVQDWEQSGGGRLRLPRLVQRRQMRDLVEGQDQKDQSSSVVLTVVLCGLRCRSGGGDGSALAGDAITVRPRRSSVQPGSGLARARC